MEKEAAIRQMKPAEIRAKLQEKGEDTSGPKTALVRRLCNAGNQPAAGSGTSEPQGVAKAAAGPRAKRPRVAATTAEAGEKHAEWPLATPLSLQAPPVRALYQAAGERVRQGLLTPTALAQYFTAMKQHFEAWWGSKL